MKAVLAALTGATLLLGTISAQAADSDTSPGASQSQKIEDQDEKGASIYSPGHLNKDDPNASDEQLGASGYSPGHEKADDNDSGPGASNYAPGQKKKDY